MLEGLLYMNMTMDNTFNIFSESEAWTETSVMDFLLSITCPDENGYVQKMYRCDLCKKVGKDRSNMRRHMILIHAQPSNLPCPYHCGQVFKNKHYLSKHVNSKICIRNQKFPI